MSEAKHTPGPWRVSHSNWFNILTESRPASVPSLVASVSLTASKNVGLTDAERAEFQANAHLIAAAPDLLAACDAAYDFIFDQLELIQAPNPLKRGGKALRLLRAAIAKAEGEAPPAPNRE